MTDASTTNDLRVMMTDPLRVNYRVFVGCIPTDTMVPQELADLMASFGEVEGVLLNRGFGFVQFRTEESAVASVAANGRIVFRGRKVDVKPARPMKRGGDETSEVLPAKYGSLSNDKGREPTKYPVTGIRFSAPATKAPERANDCEIIVVSKGQTDYAEYIEQKLRRIGLTVDLLFPNEDVPVSRVLTNIANRGCLFAVVVTAQNEEHRSMTLNILHGPPQEHRNMPLEDAISLVSRSYDAYKNRDTPRPVQVPTVTPVPTADRHPDSIQVLVNLLAENRMLTVLQYDTIISYLQQRRTTQVKVELGDSAPVPVPPPIGTTSVGIEQDKQTMLQSRIMNILNKKVSDTSSPSPVPPPAAIPAARPQLLQDPGVQKALNSILPGLQSDFLRKLAEKR